uniref:Peptidase S1 domain-containing protein n=1 Tax=Salvator merianae TaxID=96440 RepID=A0A8D0DQM8_SALMN
MLQWGRLRPAATTSFLAVVVLLAEAPSEDLTSVLDRNECGSRPLSDGTGSRIVGGHDAQPGAWPWQVSLQIYRIGIGYLHVCGGSLITNDSVLSAAHCVRMRKPELWRAVLGLHHLYRHNYHTVKIRVLTIISHYRFSKRTFANDIAVFILSKPILYSDYIQPICLPEAHLFLNDDMPCYITGWGLTKERGRGSYILQEAGIKNIPLEICNEEDWYDGTVSRNNLCAGSETGHVDACQGDSGGPMSCYLPHVAKYYLIGITSYGIGCGRPKAPGVYVHVSSYRNWILRVLNKSHTTDVPHILIVLTVMLEHYYLTL